MSNKLLYLIIASLILLLVSLVVFSNLIRGYLENKNSTSVVSPSPVPSGIIPTAVILPDDLVKGLSIHNVLTLNPTEGMGLDLNSPEIKNSIAQIEKIKDKLPYKKSFTSTRGLEVDVLIPSYDILINKWTLNVEVFLLDYAISESSPEYEKNKQAFLEAARDVFYWLKSNGVNTEQIIIQWGDREFIQTRAEEWLR